MLNTVMKYYRGFPAAHRQPKHDGHCRMIHGHNWDFAIEFGCEMLDSNGFVVDVGKLKPVKEMLTKLFDHTLLINEDDPLKNRFLKMHRDGLADVRIVPNCGMEGLAACVYRCVGDVLLGSYKEEVDVRGLRVLSVVCWEDFKNAARYEQP